MAQPATGVRIDAHILALVEIDPSDIWYCGRGKLTTVRMETLNGKVL